MAGPGALLALGGLLGGLLGGEIHAGGARGGPRGNETPPPDLEVEDPQTPKCFSRTLHDLSCFWDSPETPPDPRRYRLQFRIESDPWQECPLAAAALAPALSRFWCSLPASATVTFVPLELRVLPGPGGVPQTPPPPSTGTPPTGTPLFQRTLYIDHVVLPEPPQNVSVVPGGGRGELCVRWAPPPAPYLESSLRFELALSPPGGPPKTVGVPAGRREQRVGGLRGSTPYTVRARARPDGVVYGGFWSPWSPPTTARTPPDVDGVTLGLSCLLVVLLLGLGALGILGHRRVLRAKLWPPVPGPEREFEGLFSAYGGNFQLWLCQGVGGPCAPPAPPPQAEELPSAVEEVGGPLPPPAKGPPPTPHEEEEEEGEERPPPCAPPPSGGASPSPSFEYTLFDPGSALLCPPPPPPPPPPTAAPPPPLGSPYANLGPPKATPPPTAPPPARGGAPKGREGGGGGGGRDPPALGVGPPYVICS